MKKQQKDIVERVKGLSITKKRIFDGLGQPIRCLESGIRYRMVDHGYYTTALKPGEVDSIRPVIPREEERYIALKLNLKRIK